MCVVEGFQCFCVAFRFVTKSQVDEARRKKRGGRKGLIFI